MGKSIGRKYLANWFAGLSVKHCLEKLLSITRIFQMAAGNDLPGNSVKRAASNKITFKREEEGGGAKKRGG